MKLMISFKHVKKSKIVEDRIRAKITKLEKYLDATCKIKWASYANNETHYTEVAILGRNIENHATAKHENLYKTFDLVVDKLEKQLEKKKGKFKNPVHRKLKAPEELNPESAWMDYDEEHFDDIDEIAS